MSKKYKFKIRSKRIQVYADKILLLRLLKRIQGRYWGIYGLLMLMISIVICFAIREDLRTWSTAISIFGEDRRTIPYFTAGLFAGAYGLWRWRNYLTKTTTNPGLVTMLITFTILGLYMVAFMPLGLSDTIDTLHYFGFSLAGVCMALTVIVDIMLRKTKKTKNRQKWQLIRIISLILIVYGLVVTLLSTKRLDYILNIALVGELAILLGFGIWILTKTYQGDGHKTNIQKLLNKIIVVD